MNIFVNSIIEAVNMVISSWSAAVNSGWTIDVNVEYNTEVNFTPWIGIYSPRINFEPSRSNIVSPFTAEVRIPVYTQDTNMKDPYLGIQQLENLTGEVYTAISCYRDLHGTVEIIKGIEWNPFNRIIEDEDVILANELIIIAEVFA